MRTWSAQKVVIIGAARQGLALARYLLAHGASVVITDQRPFEALASARQALADVPDAAERLNWVCGGHPLSLLEGATLLCPSGGVPLNLPLIEEARRRGLPLSNDSQIFLEVASCKVIGITGSAGKTTTTTLVGRIGQAAVELPGKTVPYRRVWVGGNIGSPLIAEVDQMQPADLAVMELSSFQLEIMTRSPQVAAILNITPNHLDRHGTMEAYTTAKANILSFQSHLDQAVLGRDDPGAWSLAEQVKGQLFSFGFTPLPNHACGAFLYQDDICVCTEPGAHQATWVMTQNEVSLRGEHNLLNVMAACAVAAAAGLPVEAMRAGVRGFTGVPHRLEFVRSWGGADWYNDSMATAPERTMAAIRSFHEPLILLAGGRDKQLPWEEFAALVSQRVDHLIVFGEAADIILRAIEPNKNARLKITHCKGLREAVDCAVQVIQPGVVVLLSPGGTSFDEFQDFEERGECFALWVKELP
jgi:UDP-N-acetylmuramoylalanine--D-glutamate ligase